MPPVPGDVQPGRPHVSRSPAALSRSPAALSRSPAALSRSPAAPSRSPWRRFAEARGWLGGFVAPTLTARLRAADGTALVGSFVAGPSHHRAAVVLAHGFGANRKKPAYVRLAEGLAAHAPVLSLDLRGHGDSGGASSFGDLERADVTAAVRWLGGFGIDRVVLVGASMGATAVLHAAGRDLLPPAGDGFGTQPPELAGLVLISAPSHYRDPAPPGPLRRLERLWHDPLRRTALEVGLGIRLAPPSVWSDPPEPAALARRVVAPALVVHGEDDAYFPLADARALHRAAAGPAQLWCEPAGFGHAEDGLSPAVVDRLGAAIDTALDAGRFPARGAAGAGGFKACS